MKFSSKLIIFPLIFLHFLCMPRMSTSIECCQTKTCNSKSPSNDGTISIEFPFHVRDPHQSEPCGCPRFGLFCDDKLGLLLELPEAGNLTVKNIYHHFNGILVSDRNDCLPQKLLSLDLTNTPFQKFGQSEEYLVYNCSGSGQDYGFSYDDIDCLKSSNYSIVSVMPGTTVTNSECELLKKVSVSTINADSHDHLSKYSSLLLEWNQQDCESCDSSATNGRIRAALPILLILAAVILVSFITWVIPQYFSRRNDEQPPSVTTRDTNHVVASVSPPSSDTQGLDQIMINSYPTVVIGKSGRMIKPDDNKCPICLSDYFPGDTLKILPECLHRFHVECIDLWLSAEVTCPICRTIPCHNS